MKLEDIRDRMYFLAGQLEEAKLNFKNALGEIERAEKEQANRQSENKPTNADAAVLVGEQVNP